MQVSDRLKDLCDGLCLDCLKGRDKCGLGNSNHPDPWEAYEAERRNVFGQGRRDSRSPSTAPSSRVNLPGMVDWDNAVNAVHDAGGWV